MRVLVTGGAGFIGSHVVRDLQSVGHEVHAVIRPGGSRFRLADLGSRIQMIELELGDDQAVRRCLGSTRPDVVVHLAWYAEPGKYLDALDQNGDSLAASVALLASATDAGCRRIVVAGTCLEDAANVSESAYVAAKRSLHARLERLRTTDPTWVCGHVFYLYGPAEDRRRVVPTVIQALLGSRRIATTDGRQQRDYLHVADVAAGFRYLVESTVSGGIDISSGQVIQLREILGAIAREIGRPDLLDLGALATSPGAAHPNPGDPSTLRSLGWRPRFDIETGIADTVRWWRLQGSIA